MSEANATASKRILEEAFNQGNLGVVDELSLPMVVDHDPAHGEDLTGTAAIKEQIATYRTAFPDLEFTVQDIIATDDRAVIRWQARGTHHGELMGLAPTGKVATITGISIDRFEDGKIAESWTQWDTLGLMRQLGAAPNPGTIGEKVGIQLQRLAARRQRQKAAAG